MATTAVRSCAAGILTSPTDFKWTAQREFHYHFLRAHIFAAKVSLRIMRNGTKTNLNNWKLCVKNQKLIREFLELEAKVHDLRRISRGNAMEERRGLGVWRIAR